MILTICYLTNRRAPMAEWFFDSLFNQIGALEIRLVMVDFHADLPGRRQEMATKAQRFGDFIHVTPKPTVWQGPHRLTSRDCFAAANARNTGLCLAKDGWIAYADDLSVLLPGWMERVREAMNHHNRVTAGSYRKVLNLDVREGMVVSYSDHPAGHDSRRPSGRDQPVRLGGGALYGCSLVCPVESLLSINGWDEDCDLMGCEDTNCGLMLEQNGWEVFYDREMMTFESEERHHIEKPFVRIDKGKPPKDATHAMLDMVMHGRKWAPNYFGAEGIRGLRQRVLQGEPFPIMYIPEHDWFDGQPLREM